MDKEPQYLLQDVLKDVTRKERRTLLGVASVGILVVWAKLKLSVISVLGLTVQETHDGLFLVILGVVVVYFLVAFFIYALSDLVSWGFTVADTKSKKEGENYQHELEQEKKWKEEQKEQVSTQPLSWLDSDKIADHKRNSARYEAVKIAKGKRQSYYYWALTVTLLRVVFDFVLPLIVGGYAIRLLLFR